MIVYKCDDLYRHAHTSPTHVWQFLLYPEKMARVVSGLVLLSLLSGVLCSRYDPKPRPGSVVTVGTQARFTVLTERLVRMEWGQSHDKATFAFVNRNLPTPHFTSSTDGEWTVIETSKLKVDDDLHVHESCECIQAIIILT